ncbi:nitroreductase family deazaflavin-dependent oxidoreductase [Kribbella qitaiheensis]|uniref:Nitroreductase family deazaflavin-dependent oxidoreductase n=1 Tax=Kribbella qitaiheensis TaxID=1544730 RepID=A0A7G6X5R2_9ACTN|nr:nitroreductase family deazaflavin-dependent oxidoreductase [Kribbella qitaiheensis]QNE21577.1 nitroreductase family deazaflavin-dependent oxidoreductase [Kribbella qitaiheensis]
MSTENEYAPSPTTWVRSAVEKIEETGSTESAGFDGMSVILMTMRGVKSGKIRKVPVMRVEHDGVYAAVASLGGAPKNPVWYNNLKADPKVEVLDGTTTKQFVAREIEGEEYDLWWKRSVAAFPTYAEYQKKTTRVIPQFVLEPVQ